MQHESGAHLQTQLLHQAQSEDIWYDFFNRCMQLCAENFDFMLVQKEQELLNLPSRVVGEILDRALKIKQTVSSKEIVTFLKKFTKTSNEFDLLDNEKKTTLTNYFTLMRNTLLAGGQAHSVRADEEAKMVKPLLTWRLQNLNLTQNFYKDSEPFFHEGIFWKLYISKMNDK
mmetsp:Transcript_34695/g.53208  ORF Transcript_34695/g.53208 Transcript_34695/m.53208 type:complete len:172 (+) Transcript_34695:1459-1974(+)|eukprot:CAMPEP_0170503240 /NCGR_PEP_ID=MMETSP0208-20121228/44084_1 /TAXON_ID=197538 /ORGANISM="Strombidium inclinatum, Strain S3" /LENGTH=171 /DNA_ID=CAMNT_0010782785 /DNA_START=1396 /DNA_END=1911 /DNA_ORIENTATION=+